MTRYKMCGACNALQEFDEENDKCKVCNKSMRTRIILDDDNDNHVFRVCLICDNVRKRVTEVKNEEEDISIIDELICVKKHPISLDQNCKFWKPIPIIQCVFCGKMRYGGETCPICGKKNKELPYPLILDEIRVLDTLDRTRLDRNFRDWREIRDIKGLRNGKEIRDLRGIKNVRDGSRYS